MREGCIAAREGRQAEFPNAKRKRERKAREATLLLAERQGVQGRAVLLQRRPAEGIWGGLWSPPQFEDAAAALDWLRAQLGEAAGVPQALAPIDHAFTHFDLRLHPLRVTCAGDEGVREDDSRLWYTLDAPQRVGLPQPIKSLLDTLRDSTFLD